MKVGDHVRISKYKNTFSKVYAPSWSEKGFVISRIKNTVPWTYVGHVHTSSFALKSNLASLKTKNDTWDIDKLVIVPVDLSRLSNVVKNDVVINTVYGN